MNFLDKLWHKIAGQKSTVVRDPTDRYGMVTIIPDNCRVILIADWGANNDHAANIRDLIKKEIAAATVPLYLIHLGNIYYSGLVLNARHS